MVNVFLEVLKQKDDLLKKFISANMRDGLNEPGANYANHLALHDAIVVMAQEQNRLTYRHLLEQAFYRVLNSTPKKNRKELISLAALCIYWAFEDP